jgi:hypothetical protein
MHKKHENQDKELVVMVVGDILQEGYVFIKK